MTEPNEVQVVVRKREVCERCGAVQPFVKRKCVRYPDGSSVDLGRCKRCGASVKIVTEP